MNARQKAKKYKKIAERYKDKAEAWDRYMKVTKYWDDRVPEEILKEEIARDIAECLLKEGYIDFKVNDYNEYNMVRRVVAAIKVTKVGESE